MVTPLSLLTRPTGPNRALLDGSVRPDGFELQHVDVPVLVQGFRRMVRSLEFDVAEMAVTTYLCAKEHGVAFTALPVFLVRDFHHGAVRANRAAVRSAADLAGRRVGVNRGYTVTTGVWARAILAEEGGLDLSSVTWVLSGDEHVATYRPPPNVVPLESGTSLEQALSAGDLVATVGADVAGPGIAPLFPPEAGLGALLDRGLYPINHLVVVRDQVLAEHPRAAVALLDAFTAAKETYVGALDGLADPDETDLRYRAVRDLTASDPLPYGVEGNRDMLERLIGHAIDQGILTTRPAVEDLFAVGTQRS